MMFSLVSTVGGTAVSCTHYSPPVWQALPAHDVGRSETNDVLAAASPTSPSWPSCCGWRPVAASCGDTGQPEPLQKGARKAAIPRHFLACFCGKEVVPLDGLEPPTRGLGNRCSVHLSYRGPYCALIAASAAPAGGDPMAVCQAHTSILCARFIGQWGRLGSIRRELRSTIQQR